MSQTCTSFGISCFGSLLFPSTFAKSFPNSFLALFIFPSLRKGRASTTDMRQIPVTTVENGTGGSTWAQNVLFFGQLVCWVLVLFCLTFSASCSAETQNHSLSSVQLSDDDDDDDDGDDLDGGGTVVCH